MIPDVKRGEPITAAHFNAVKRAATKKHVGEGIFETSDFIVHRSVDGPSGGVSGMRFVAIAGGLPVSTDTIAVYPVTRNGTVFLLDLDGDGLPAETEVMNVWPHMRSSDFFPFFIITGDGKSYAADGTLDQSTTLCPAYFVDGEWWVHNTAKMSWAIPDTNATFSSCGSRVP